MSSIGFIIAFITSLLSTSKDLVSKKLAANVSGNVSAFASFFYALPFYVILIIILSFLGLEDFAFSSRFFYLVILRALTDSFAELFKMHTLALLEVSVASCFLSLSTVFLLLISPVVTGDVPSLLGAIGVLLAVFGSLLVVYKPGGFHFQGKSKGIAFALGAAFFFSLNGCFDRLAVQVASPTLSGFFMTLLSAVLLFPFIFFKKGSFEQLKNNSTSFFLRGFFEVCFMVTKLCALLYLQAPYVGGIMKLSILFSILGGKIVFKEENLKQKLVAGVLITIGVVCIAFA